ncbi:hypothetical protein [Stenotrophomonas sp. GD03657]|uniref:hypothetical protein n=1 Tax=Stenotrophomonas sp. GD03657 TaxID=2975363 RepID=UPI00244B7C32|nr:hypothetical protein [Stenotrophomonas sp. GD03657]MDH2154326.1 hypothetical protein [Stenotrophomonas sp. GD03657]
MAIAVCALMGWIEGAPEKLDYLFSCYFESEHSQTNLYLGKVASLPYQIQAFGSDRLLLQQAASKSLQDLFTRYFDAAVVTVLVDTTVEDPGRFTITVTATVTQDGVTHDVGYSLSALTTGKLIDIIKLNNQGA